MRTIIVASLVLNRVESRELTAAQAGELMGLSVRQVRRLLAAYRREGVVAIAHGNRGRRPPLTVSEAVREVALASRSTMVRSKRHIRVKLIS